MKKEISPGVTVVLISVGSSLMTVKVELKKGSVVPEHSHRHEQTSFIQSGRLLYKIDGKEITLKEGEGIIVKPDLPHSCTALEDTIDINTFFPLREDYLKILA